MSREFLGDRERGLENEFFYRVDQELWQKLREQTAREEKIASLREATGIQDQKVLEELVDLDISEDSLMALSLYPLVRVAWSDGSIEKKERDAVLEAAGQVGHTPGTPGYHLLDIWMEQRPPEKVHQAWRDYVHALCQTVSAETKASMKQNLLDRARKVAEAAGGILGINKVSSSEEAVLEELDREFEAA